MTEPEARHTLAVLQRGHVFTESAYAAGERVKWSWSAEDARVVQLTQQAYEDREERDLHTVEAFIAIVTQYAFAEMRDWARDIDPS